MQTLIRPLVFCATVGVAGVLGSSQLTADPLKPTTPPPATFTGDPAKPPPKCR